TTGGTFFWLPLEMLTVTVLFSLSGVPGFGSGSTTLPAGASLFTSTNLPTRWLDASACSAAARFRPISCGTVVWPGPRQILYETVVPSSTLVLAAGVWSVTVFWLQVGSLNWVGLGFSFAWLSSRLASSLLCPCRSGTGTWVLLW